MKKVLYACVVLLSNLSCSKSTGLEKYFTEQESKELLINMVTYMAKKAPLATLETQFNADFRKYYENSEKQFKIINIERKKDSSYVFFLTRPVGNLAKFRRGVIGEFKLKKNSMMPLDFREIVNTPHLEEKVVLERGGFLFNYYVKNHSIDNYLGMKHYVEWPDSTLVYDLNSHEWVSPQKSKTLL
jgi:hypothetical protein